MNFHQYVNKNTLIIHLPSYYCFLGNSHDGMSFVDTCHLVSINVPVTAVLGTFEKTCPCLGKFRLGFELKDSGLDLAVTGLIQV